MDVVGVRAVRVPGSRAELALGPRSLVVGGGSWVYSEAHHAGVDELVDLMGLGWEPLESAPGGGLRIAATCTIGQLVAVQPRAGWHPTMTPLFRQTADSLLMSWKIWQAATVGGNLCLALPAGAMTGLLVALDAEAIIWQADDGERRMAVADFVQGVQATALGPGEVLRAIELPAAALAARGALKRASLAPTGRTGSLLVGRRTGDGSVVMSVTGATSHPHRFWFPELPTPGKLHETILSAVGDTWFDDPHGSPDWRRAVTLVLAEELLGDLA